MNRWNKSLIGKKARILFCQNFFFGTIIDETRHTILLNLKNGDIKRIIKKKAIIQLVEEGIELNGRFLRGRVEERIKDRKSKSW